MDLAAALDRIRTRHNATLATIRGDGRPQLSNVGFTLGDDGVIRMSITDDRAKTRNLRRDGRAALHVGGDTFWQYVVIDGDVELSAVTTDPNDPTAGELVEQYRSVAGDHPDWDEFRQAMITERRLVARLVPTHAYGMWS